LSLPSIREKNVSSHFKRYNITDSLIYVFQSKHLSNLGWREYYLEEYFGIDVQMKVMDLEFLILFIQLDSPMLS
jgi:hypothetical protein